MSNMAAELGAQAGLIMPDEKTAAYIEAAGGIMPVDWQQYSIEQVAKGDHLISYDAPDLEPQIAAPHTPEELRKDTYRTAAL